MALEEYRRKRDFAKTPEPKGSRVSSHSRQLSYLIQKHDATRLHYDFRLELDGILLSWAVTKGPSINPADKRLAVRTEDHPLSYGTFEGTIPKGQYGGGTVMLWDQGTWEPRSDPHAGLKKGHLSFVLHGKRLKGGWDLIRMRTDEKRENWLLIKSKDAEASNGAGAAKFLDDLSVSVASQRSMDEIASGKGDVARKNAPAVGVSKALRDLMKRYPAMQLATLVEEPPEGDNWIHEVKFDGYRLFGFLSDGEVRLRTRNDQDWTESFPAIASALERLQAEDAVLDMEAVILDASGKSNFQGLQAALAEDPQAIIAFAFDLLHLDGENLVRLPLLERKDKLKVLLRKSKTGKSLRYSDHVGGEGSKMLEQSCKLGLEGILSKEGKSPYLAGRQKSWLKSKCSQRQEFVIAGYSDAKSGGRSMGALYLAYHKANALHYAGKVGTGFSMQSARELTARFKKLGVTEPVFNRSEMQGTGLGEWQSIHWVKPELVCEVAFTEWTRDGRIRHPSFQGLREDKPADSIKQEKPVATTPPKSRVSRTPSGTLQLNGARITHPERVISESGHITKGDLAEYYSAVAPVLMPRIARRPLSLLRCPEGFDKQCFYQRNPGKGWGDEVFPFKFKHGGKTIEYLYIESERGLLALVQMNAVEIHPWGARIDSIDYPDEVIFDLDPAPEVPFEAVKLAAMDLRARLKKKGLDPRLKCTGGKGLHVSASLDGKQEWGTVKKFAEDLADEMVRAAPQAYTATMSKAKRTGKIFIDYFRNDYTATAIADYSVRARPGAPVAMPLAWKDLKSLASADQFSIHDARAKVEKSRKTAK